VTGTGRGLICGRVLELSSTDWGMSWKIC